MNKNQQIKTFKFDKHLISGHKKNDVYETLQDHSDLTLNFYKRFVKKRKIKFVFESLGEKRNQSLIKQMENIIYLHDLGKLNPYSQKYYKGKLEKSSKTAHSKLSFLLIFLLNYDIFEKLKDRSLTIENRTEEHIEALYLLLFSFCVTFHHTNLSKYMVVTNRNGIPIISIKSLLNHMIDENKVVLQEILENNFSKWNKNKKVEQIREFFNQDILTKTEKSNLFFNIKLFYALLVLSDYHATYAYQSGKGIKELKINQIDRKLLNKIETNFHKVRYNQKLNAPNQFILNPSNCGNINELRDNLIKQAIKTLQNNLKNTDNKVFTLTVPTGGGKTNISIKLTLEILNSRLPTVNRINWVFPYVNIIEQNFSVIQKTLFKNKKESENILSQIYHDSFDLTEKELIDYDKNTNEIFEKYLNLSFINNPINVISNVNFFNAFFKVKKNDRYKFANFVNSIVILDEIQSLNSDYLNLFYNILYDLSKKYNIYFIVMSATLPNPSDFTEKNISTELITNSSEYFNHSIFKRNKLEFHHEKLTKFNKLYDFLKRKILKKHKSQNKFLIVVNTVKTSIELFKKFKKDTEFKKSKFNIFLLNSLVGKKDRKKIIKQIRSYKNKNTLLVSTQSIEAGVDLDFDTGFRDYSIIDSIEQVSGRINRECEIGKKSKLYVFKYATESNVYKNDLRFKLLQETKIDIINILKTKNFSDYYKQYFNRIKREHEIANKIDYSKEIHTLNYAKIHKDLNVVPINNGLKIISNKINQKDKNKKILSKYNCNTMQDLIFLKNEKRKILDKPFAKFLSSLIYKNSVELKFYNKLEESKFKAFLKNNNFILNELNEHTFLVNDAFFKKYNKTYANSGKIFIYFDIHQLLKKDYKLFKQEMFSGIFL